MAEGDRIGEIMARVAAGDSEAFEALYDRLAPRVWSIAHTATGSRDLAEEAAILVFQDLWRGAADCPAEPDAAIGWALGIAVRRCAGPSGHVLSPEQRDAIVLSYCGGLTLKQLAGVLELDRESAADLLCDGLRRVRDQPADRRFPALHR